MGAKKAGEKMNLTTFNLIGSRKIVTIDENLNKIPNELIYLSSWSKIYFLSSEERKGISHLKINYKAFYAYLKDINVS